MAYDKDGVLYETEALSKIAALIHVSAYKADGFVATIWDAEKHEAVRDDSLPFNNWGISLEVFALCKLIV